MPTIVLPERFADNFGHPLQKLLDLLDELTKCSKRDEIILNYRNGKFTHPFYVLALPLIVKQYERNGFNITVSTDFIHQGIREYMYYIKFPHGIYPNDFPQEGFPALLELYKNKSYIPIISFPTGEGQDVTIIRDNFLSAVNRLLIHICNLSNSLVTGLMYLIDEAVNNVLHHSKDECGYLLAQYYRSKGYIDIVIADIGQTILDTYSNFEKYSAEVVTHKLAMEAALQGKSTKSLDIDRGFGISTSKRLLTEGLNGKYFIYSGNVFNIHTLDVNDIIELPENIFWQGVYVCLRIPIVAPAGFNPANYYE